jgi:hypothetical protein
MASQPTAHANAELFRRIDPVWCDPPMVDLLAAAADTYPVEPIQPHHLRAPNGIVIFAKPMPVVWHNDAWEPTDQPLSAISSAETTSATDGQPLLGITGWQPAAGPHHFDEPKLAVRYTGLRAASNAIGPYDGAFPDPGVAGPHRILQTLTALCRTPPVRDEVAPASKAARAGLTDPPVRRVHLRRPEHAQHDLDAARAARAGHPPRGHGVRGHWKNQWHRSLGEHRPTWIAGYPRGDFTAGSRTGTMVLIASDRPPADGRDR